MNTSLPSPPADLAGTLLGHLDRQLASARRLLELVLHQHEAIRARRVDQVLTTMLEIQREMEARGALEDEREQVLRRAAGALGMSTLDVTLERLCSVIDDIAAQRARHHSAELRGLLDEISRKHAINRALMRQELAFLDHLTRLAGGEPGPGYDRDAVLRSAVPITPGAGLHALDARA
ncbi:MAG TPA: flagellar export chaperone FlgN [Solirubrobacteraceae bacterium]|nr:flagellar export chaperone FlgN [Solirubrobacteraceae bacterium]